MVVREQLWLMESECSYDLMKVVSVEKHHMY